MIRCIDRFQQIEIFQQTQFRLISPPSLPNILNTVKRSNRPGRYMSANYINRPDPDIEKEQYPPGNPSLLQEDAIHLKKRLLDTFRAPSRLAVALMSRTSFDILFPVCLLLLAGILYTSIRNAKFADTSRQMTEERIQEKLDKGEITETEAEQERAFEQMLYDTVLFITLFIQNRIVHIILFTAILYSLGRFVFKQEHGILLYLGLVCYGCLIQAGETTFNILEMLLPFLRVFKGLNLSFLVPNSASVLSYLLSDLGLFSIWLIIYYSKGLAQFTGTSIKRTLPWILGAVILMSLHTPIRMGYPFF